MNLLKRICGLIFTKLDDKFCILFVPQILSHLLKDSANVSLKLSGAGEICPSKLSRTKNKLSIKLQPVSRSYKKAISFRKTDFSI